MKDLIRKLVEAWGPSGFEHHVRKLIQAEVADYADEITVDPLGNLICRVGSGGKKIMVAAHMDEIGVFVTFEEKSTGYLRFSNIGGLAHGALLGNRVKFEDGTIGVVAVANYLTSNRRNLPETDDFYIDVSDGSGKNPVSVGSPASFWRPMEERGTRLISKAMDDRIGCAIAIETMRRLKGKDLSNEIYFVFTVQEEVGIRGATTAAYHVDPDVAIALDVTLTGEEPNGDKFPSKLGAGAAIKLHDSGHIVPPVVRDWMIERAEKDGIKHQFDMIRGGTTDAARIQIARAGVPSGTISIPTRYVHTVSETVDYDDVLACVDLLTGLVANRVEFLENVEV